MLGAWNPENQGAPLRACRRSTRWRFSFLQASRRRSWSTRGAIDSIYTQGDACEDVMYIQAGGVKLSVSHMLARNIRVEEDLIDQLFNSSENGWRGRVNFFLNKFEKLGFIGVVLHD
jgi:hypothetical protein